QGHPRVSAGSGTHEWAASPAIRYAAVGVSSMLGLTSTVVANTVGYIGYPVLAVVQNGHALWNELGRWMPGVVAAAVVGAAVLALTLAPRAPGVRDPFTRFGITVGALWALLIYVPVSTSFAYPRIVGQSADRANMLALFGVALCVGSLVAAVTDRLGGHARPKVF